MLWKMSSSSSLMSLDINIVVNSTTLTIRCRDIIPKFQDFVLWAFDIYRALYMPLSNSPASNVRYYVIAQTYSGKLLQSHWQTLFLMLLPMLHDPARLSFWILPHLPLQPLQSLLSAVPYCTCLLMASRFSSPCMCFVQCPELGIQTCAGNLGLHYYLTASCKYMLNLDIEALLSILVPFIRQNSKHFKTAMRLSFSWCENMTSGSQFEKKML